MFDIQGNSGIQDSYVVHIECPWNASETQADFA